MQVSPNAMIVIIDAVERVLLDCRLNDFPKRMSSIRAISRPLPCLALYTGR